MQRIWLWFHIQFKILWDNFLPQEENIDLPEDYIGYWENDLGDRACRIWIFWKYKIIDDSELIFYKNALWLVFLTQLLSCAVEQVFYQIDLIVDAVGQNMTEEITELVMFLMCNGYLNVYNSKSEGYQKYCTSYY